VAESTFCEFGSVFRAGRVAVVSVCSDSEYALKG
jgi:hypothetical protein